MEFFELAHKRFGTTGLALSTVATLFFSAVYAYHVQLSRQRPGEAPMKWSWLPIIGSAIELGSRPLEFLSQCAEENNEIFGMVVAGKRMFIVADVLSCNVVLKPPRFLSYEEFIDLVLENFFGANFSHPNLTGIGCLDEHLMRTWYNNLLSDSSLGDLTERLQAQVAKDLPGLGLGLGNPGNRNSRTVPLYEFVSKLVFQASVASLFSPEAAEDPDLFAAFRAFDQHLPLAAGGFKVDYANGPKQARALLLKAVRRYKSEANCDFIKKRFTYFDSFGNENDANAFQLAVLWASVGNTMPTMFWMLYYLMVTPEALQRLLQEIAAVCPSSASGSVRFGQNQLNRLLYLDCCITEALRLCAGNMIMRHVREPCELTMASGKTYKFRKGDRVGLCPPLWHRDAELYPDPLRFDPARWLLVGDAGKTEVGQVPSDEAAMAAQGRVQLSKGGKTLPSGMGYLPFGGGATLCPGRKFARNELKTLAVCLLATARLELCPGQAPPQLDGARAGVGIFPPKIDLHVRISAL